MDIYNNTTIEELRSYIDERLAAAKCENDSQHKATQEAIACLRSKLTELNQNLRVIIRERY